MYKHIKFLPLLLTCVGLYGSETSNSNTTSEEQQQNWFAPSNGEQYIVGFDGGDKNYPVIIRQLYVSLSCYLRNLSNPNYRRVQSFGTRFARAFGGAEVKTVYLLTFQKPYKIEMHIEAYQEGAFYYEESTFAKFIDQIPETEPDAKECAKSICYFLESINNRPSMQTVMNYTNAYYIFLNINKSIDKLLDATKQVNVKRGFLLGIQEYVSEYFQHYGFVSYGSEGGVSGLLRKILNTNSLDPYYYNIRINPNRKAAMGGDDMDKLYAVLKKIDDELIKLNPAPTQNP